jgi:hypothetical protein
LAENSEGEEERTGRREKWWFTEESREFWEIWF